MSINKCRICGETGNFRKFIYTEKMFQHPNSFEYFQCPGCHCLQISNVPQDIYHFYGTDYYSFHVEECNLVTVSIKDRLKKSLKQIRDKSYFSRNKISLGNILQLFSYNDILRNLGRIFSENRVTTNSSILDVGCGDGSLLKQLMKFGYINLTGVDPFFRNETVCYSKAKLQLRKCEIVDIGEDETFDVIMFHHSLEHIENEVDTLLKVTSLLKNEHSVCVIRIPIIAYAWEKYGENWGQLDVPRHYYLHTEDSFRCLAERCGLTVQEVIFDSNPWMQILASEAYQNGFAYTSHEFKTYMSSVNSKRLQKLKQFTDQLNYEHRGDMAMFCCKKKC